MSIRVETVLHDYCSMCEDFTSTTSQTTIYGDGAAVETVVVATCVDYEKCERMFKFFKEVQNEAARTKS